MGTIEFQCILTIFPFDGGHSHSGCFFDILMSRRTKALSLLQVIERSTVTRTMHERKKEMQVCECVMQMQTRTLNRQVIILLIIINLQEWCDDF